MLRNWARAAAALRLLDEFAVVHGWLDREGNPYGFTRLYVSLLNSERLALARLEEHLRAAGSAPLEALSDYLDSTAEQVDDEGG